MQRCCNYILIVGKLALFASNLSFFDPFFGANRNDIYGLKKFTSLQKKEFDFQSISDNKNKNAKYFVKKVPYFGNFTAGIGIKKVPQYSTAVFLSSVLTTSDHNSLKGYFCAYRFLILFI